MADDYHQENIEDSIEISFIMSRDELYTLILLNGEPSEWGKNFVETELGGAQKNNLLNLADKRMASFRDGKLFIEPVIRMMGAAICKTYKTEKMDGVYIIYSQWINIRYEIYSQIEGYVRLTPIKPEKI